MTTDLTEGQERSLVDTVAEVIRGTREFQAGVAFGVPDDARDVYSQGLARAALDFLDAEERLSDPPLPPAVQARYDTIRAGMRADRDAAAAEAKVHALAAVTITDPTGHEMRPAEVRVSNRGGEWAVILDFGPFAKALPVESHQDAAAVAWAFIHLLGGVEYDLSALPDEETP